jgi:hypothetical protein
VNTYDFRSLNDKEFEAVVADLLSEHLGVHVERFKPGKDKGVDGRWFAAGGRETILQCKHWVGTGYSAMLRLLRASELPKIQRLSPSRYLLATSVPLSRSNKREIVGALSPFLLSASDVLGPEDLNDLLGRYGSVERRHYKLWLASSSALSALLNYAVVGRSRAELDDMRRDAAVYASTADHAKARERLSQQRVLILTGEPGIGKTTLARQLILEYAAEKYELVVLEESISEAEAVYAEESKQLFYFDDFLGRTYLEALKAKQDSHIANFMKRVARDPADPPESRTSRASVKRVG